MDGWKTDPRTKRDIIVSCLKVFKLNSKFTKITIYGYCGDEKVCEDEAAFTHTDGLEAEYILESGENDGVNWFLDE